ncbi:hypothetical protein N9O24_01100, partial [bacterium]|nr:hypothetical protein [bacterium]
LDSWNYFVLYMRYSRRLILCHLSTTPLQKIFLGALQAHNTRKGCQRQTITRTRIRDIPSVSLLCILNILADISWRYITCIYHLH